MSCEYYRILCDGYVVAESMHLETACVLVKALFEQYHAEPVLRYSIERQDEDHARQLENEIGR